jgi:hypothetical protein
LLHEDALEKSKQAQVSFTLSSAEAVLLIAPEGDHAVTYTVQSGNNLIPALVRKPSSVSVDQDVANACFELI